MVSVFLSLILQPLIFPFPFQVRILITGTLVLDGKQVHQVVEAVSQKRIDFPEFFFNS
jgi:hypothetical protein